MKITVFTSNQPRHRALVAALASVADSCHAIVECKTVFPGRVRGFYEKSEPMQRYFERVQASEKRVFGEVGYIEDAAVLALQRGDLSLLQPEDLGPAMDADVFVSFGSSIIKGRLIEELGARRAINLHLGLSPWYRGSSTNFWAVADGNPHMVGATIHLLTAGVDAGDILFHAVPDPAGCTDVFDFTMASAKAGQDALVARIADGSIATMAATPQDRSQEIRYSRNAQFTDEVAEQFLSAEPTIESIAGDVARRRGEIRLVGTR